MADHTLSPKNTQEYLQFVQHTAKFINEHFGESDLAIVLGSGLNNFTDELTEKKVLEFHEIPYFPQPTVKGHSGKFVSGKVGDRKIFCLAGRVHSYEGRQMYELTFITRVLALAGVKLFIATNASGGAGEGMYPGCLMIIRDHVNCYRRNPLHDSGDIPIFGEKHPDLSYIYSERIATFAKQTASQLNIKLFEGVYGGTSGPTYETPSEVKAFHKFGVAAFGMSTMPETMAAHSLGMEVFGISLITNMAAGITDEVLTHKAVTEVASESGPNFIRFMKKFLSEIKSEEKFGKPRENKPFEPTPLPYPFVPPATSEHIQEALKAIESFGKEHTIAILLSEGHDSLLDRLHDKHEVAYSSVPHFPAISSCAHKGKFVFGTLTSKKVVVLAGNSLEGFACEEATFIVELLHALGVHTIVQTFISGTVSEDQNFPRVLALKDANDSTTTHPVVPSSSVSQYHTETKLFDPILLEELKKLNIQLGVYTHVPGPSYPTLAEVHTAKLFHFDTVGMTSLSVVYAARSVDIRVVGIAELAYFKPPTSVHTDGKILHTVESFVDKLEPHSNSKKWTSGHRNSAQVAYQLTPPVSQGDFDVIQKAASYIKDKIQATAHVGVVVDSDLVHLCSWDKLEVKKELELKSIPGLATNQSGSLIFGELEGIPVYIVKGTNYLNEGHSAFQVTFVVRVLATLDAKTILFVSNVCSVDERLKIGDISVVRDHVLLSGRSPLFGPNEERWGTRFPDVGDAYSKNFQQLIRDQAKSMDLQIQTIGVGHFTGPIFGSNADAAVARFCNLEAITTGLAPEVLTARHMSVTTGALGVVTSGIYGENHIVGVDKNLNISEKLGQLITKSVKASTKL